jgi:hypothetical protein
LLAIRVHKFDRNVIYANFALANQNLPAIIWCFANRSRLASAYQVDVSVLAVEYRAFNFAAPQYFVARKRSTEYRGAVSVGAPSPACSDVT